MNLPCRLQLQQADDVRCEATSVCAAVMSEPCCWKCMKHGGAAHIYNVCSNSTVTKTHKQQQLKSNSNPEAAIRGLVMQLRS